jgi:hypothetical protein
MKETWYESRVPSDMNAQISVQFSSSDCVQKFLPPVCAIKNFRRIVASLPSRSSVLVSKMGKIRKAKKKSFGTFLHHFGGVTIGDDNLSFMTSVGPKLKLTISWIEPSLCVYV